MAYVRLDDQIGEHVKILRAGPAAAWMWAMAIAYSNRRLTDGFIPADQIDRLTSSRGHAAAKLAARCVDAGLFRVVTGGFQVHDYLPWNPSRDKVEQIKAAAAARKAEQRRQKDTNGTQQAVPVMSQWDLAGAGATPTPTPTPTPSSDDDDTAAPVARLVSSSPTANGTGPMHLACLELVATWNRVRTEPSVAYADLLPAAKREIRVALQAKSLDAWERIFRRISASDYLSGRGEYAAVSLFKALDLGDRIAAGQYDNRAAKPTPVDAVPDYTPRKFRHLKGAV